MSKEDLAEASIWRPAPPGAYRLPAAILTLRKNAMDYTRAVFRETAARRLEACCFWYGFRSAEGGGEVVAVVVPRQRNNWGNYSVSAPAIGEMATATRHRGWVNLAQVHTHPGREIEHSRYDDDQANSRRALSVVLPFYGKWQRTWPAGVGVHEFQDDYWHLLSENDAASRVIVADIGDAELLDLR